MTQKDLSILAAATLRIYKESAVDAVKGFRKNWYWAFLPLPHLVIIAVVAFVVSPMGMAGGFILAAFEALCLANYFVALRSAVQKEPLYWRELWPRTLEIFPSVISVLFALSVVSVGFQLIARTSPAGELNWILIAFNLIVLVIFNPLPEATYTGRYSMLNAFQECLEFLKENHVEWFVPMLLPFLAIILTSPMMFLVTISVLTPMTMGQGFAFYVISSFLVSSLPFLGALIVALSIAFLAMIFRGALFNRLSSTTRRKRIYQAKMGGA